MFEINEIRAAAAAVVADVGPLHAYATGDEATGQACLYRDERGGPKCFVGYIYRELYGPEWHNLEIEEGQGPNDQPFSDQFDDASLDFLLYLQEQQDTNQHLPWAFILADQKLF